MSTGAQDFKKWLAIGTGVGIEIGHQDLTVVVVRVRPGGTRVLGSLVIHRYAEQRATEWGTVYSQFLKKLGARHLAASVSLPRDQIIVRQISLPGVSNRDLPNALSYQIDSLHPYSDEDVVYSSARIGKSANILIGIVRRATVDRYSALFSEAGIKISAFTFSAASVYTAVRMYSNPPAEGFLAVTSGENGLEVYGESPARPVFSAQLQGPEERMMALALSELRLPADTEPLRMDAVLPKPALVPENEDLSRTALPYATALAGACPWLALGVNLLPAEQRKSSSRLIYVPSIVLGVLLLLSVGALTGTSRYQNRRYLDALNREIHTLDPRARKAAEIEKQIAVTRNRTQTLDNFRLHSIDDMNALSELTKILAPPTYLTSLQLNRDSVTLAGETDQAAGLLKLLDGSHQFRRSDFSLPLSRNQTGEVFSIRSTRQGIAP